MSVSWTCDDIIKLGHMTMIDTIPQGQGVLLNAQLVDLCRDGSTLSKECLEM